MLEPDLADLTMLLVDFTIFSASYFAVFDFEG